MKEEIFNPYKRYNGIYIPNGVYNYPALTPTSKLVYGRLLRYAGEDGKAFPKQKTLAEALNVGLTTIQNSIYQLIDEGFISVVKGDSIKHEANTYYFIEHECLGKEENEGGMRRPRNGVSANSDSGSLNKESHSKESIKRNIKEKSYSNPFESWWKYYPRKKNKPKAFKCWERLDNTERKAALAAIKDHPPKNESTKYIPHPASWLAAMSWEDDVDRDPEDVLSLDERLEPKNKSGQRRMKKEYRR